MNEEQENKVDEVKQQTVKTFNEAKEQIKNINLKEEAKVGKGLLLRLWKQPIETIKEIATDEENKNFKTALLLVAVWVVIAFIRQILYYVTSPYADFEFLPTLKVVLTPVLRVLAMTLAVYFVNNRAKESISKVLTSVAVAYIPSIVYSLLFLLYFVSSNMLSILTPIGGILEAVSVVLMYHTVKALSEENEEHTLKKFVKVEVVFYVIAFVISFLGISI